MFNFLLQVQASQRNVPRIPLHIKFPPHPQPQVCNTLYRSMLPMTDSMSLVELQINLRRCLILGQVLAYMIFVRVSLIIIINVAGIIRISGICLKVNLHITRQNAIFDNAWFSFYTKIKHIAIIHFKIINVDDIKVKIN